MRAAVAIGVLGALVSCQSSGASPIAEARADNTPTAAVTPAAPAAPGALAVVELFTSEGCSSCPPADAELTELAASRDVVALSFQVDYWDDLGWRDRFASAGNTERQRLYARAFGARGVYTPQMIVGGTEAFVGSDRSHADAAVARSLGRAPSVSLAVHVRRQGDDAVAVDYAATGAPRGSVLDVALVQHSVSSAVRAGENAGRTMKHTDVVREFLALPLASPSGSTVVRVPAGLDPHDAEIVVYAQVESADGTGMPILGASRAPLP